MSTQSLPDNSVMGRTGKAFEGFKPGMVAAAIHACFSNPPAEIEALVWKDRPGAPKSWSSGETRTIDQIQAATAVSRSRIKGHIDHWVRKGLYLQKDSGWVVNPDARFLLGEWQGVPNASSPVLGGREPQALPPSNTSDRIRIHPTICHGKPVIRGTRTPVSIVLGSLAGGMSFEDVQCEYRLSADDIRGALAFAVRLVEQEQFYPLPVG